MRREGLKAFVPRSAGCVAGWDDMREDVLRLAMHIEVIRHSGVVAPR